MNKKIINKSFFNRKNKIILETSKVVFSNKLIKFNTNNDIKKIEEQIKNFLFIMNNNCKNFDSALFLNNFQKTFFNLLEINEKNKGNGNVSSDKKGIKFKINSFNITNHELLHLATLKGNGCGFKIAYEEGKIGEGINEGCTQFLTERYFNENVGKAYFFEVEFVRILEKIIGKDNLEKNYFNLSLQGLVSELEKYEKQCNAYQFIRNLDLINEYDFNNLSKNQINELQDICTKICEFLYSCIINKINIIKTSDKSNSLKNDEINNLIDSIPTNFYGINFFDEEKINQIKESLNIKKR